MKGLLKIATIASIILSVFAATAAFAVSNPVRSAIKADGSRLYIPSSSGYIHIKNITNPYVPSPVSSQFLSAVPYDVLSYSRNGNNYLFVTGQTSGGDGYLFVFDINGDPANYSAAIALPAGAVPRGVAVYTTSEFVKGLGKVTTGHVCIADNNSGKIYNYSVTNGNYLDGAQYTLAATYATGAAGLYGLVVTNQTLLATNKTNGKIFKYGLNDASPTTIATGATNATYLALSGDEKVLFARVLQTDADIRAFNLANLDAISELTSLKIDLGGAGKVYAGNSYEGMFFKGSSLYLSKYTDLVIRGTDPEKSEKLHKYTLDPAANTWSAHQILSSWAPGATDAIVVATYEATNAIWRTYSSGGSYNLITVEAEAAVVTMEAPTIHVLYPNGGEVFTKECYAPVSWETTGIPTGPDEYNIYLEYSTNEGTSWTILQGIWANVGGYSWRINTEPSSTKYLFRASYITGYQGSVICSDESDATFTVMDSVEVTNPLVTSISPSASTVETYVVITGAGFGSTTGEVTFTARTGTVTASIPWWNPDGSEIGVIVPQGAIDGNVYVKDASGNQSAGFAFDVLPPGQVWSFAATAGNGQNTLSWDYYDAADALPYNTPVSGILIARSSTEAIAWMPTDATTPYVAGDNPAGDIQIVYNGNEKTATDHNLVNGVTYYYRAFAHDDGPNYNTSEALASATPSGEGRDTSTAVIDNFEGTLIPHAGGYYYADTWNEAELTRAIANDPSEIDSGSYSGEILYSNATGLSYAGAVWGGTYPSTVYDNGTLEVTAYDTLRFRVKGDGSNNTFRIGLQESDVSGVENIDIDNDGDLDACTEIWFTPPVSLKNLGWQTVEIPLSSLIQENGGGAAYIAHVNNVFDRKIKGYQVYYLGGESSPTAHYIDNVTVINSTSPEVNGPTLDLTALLQGYYYDSNGDGTNDTQRAATIEVEFRQGADPATATTVVTALNLTLDSNGRVQQEISSLPDGNYYLVVHQSIAGAAHGANHSAIITNAAWNFAAGSGTTINISDTTSAYYADAYESGATDALYVDGTFKLMRGGNADGDNVIAIGDFGIWSLANGSVPGDSTWNASADFDGNGAVDIGDFGIWSLNNGTESYVP